MRDVRLAVLLRRFGLKDSASASNLRAAYLMRAREHHPDAGGEKDGFVRLKQDYDEATSLLESQPSVSNRGTPGRAESSYQPQGQSWPGQHHRSSSRNAKDPPSATMPVAPPFAVWFSSAAIVLGVLAWKSLPARSSHKSVAPRPPTPQVVAAPVDVEQPAPALESGGGPVKRTSSEYYAKRVKTAEMSSALKMRPHSKQRGLTYVPPVHGAAEDGKAEWLHWAGEKSKSSVVDALDRNQQTPLHYAAAAGQLNSCAVLLKFKADPLLRDARGKTPLSLAEVAGHECAAAMMRSGAPGPLVNGVEVSLHIESLEHWRTLQNPELFEAAVTPIALSNGAPESMFSFQQPPKQTVVTNVHKVALDLGGAEPTAADLPVSLKMRFMANPQFRQRPTLHSQNMGIVG